ncbi:NUC189 domain-containing protein [Zymoseptoria brevis]|uniref:NUC189 domain-containing protein n=1 Tax=Zymoseptoria brevis TaxID=1047168 RepID=A0A0F4GJH3_9PEZI|nr:NUC189 domain-containing protein [Zymoseptoria brevis]
MSTAKRSRRRGAEASPPPASKRLKSSHVPAPQSGSGLGFLVDENARAGKKLNARLTNGIPQSKSTRVDDSRAAVARDVESLDSDDEEDVGRKPAPEIIELSSNSESSALESDEEEEAQPKPVPNGHHIEQEEQDVDMQDEDDTGDATFGDLLQARHPQPIDVSKALQSVGSNSRRLVPSSNNQLRAPLNSASLGVVLTQALKTRDKDLLEDCFRTNDVQSIKATIQRQQSYQIATLLELIAERIHKRPGRTGKLMTWVQWSLVSHGGYLANQPELMKKLKSLGQVVRERANGLQPLLHLKGKLDLLSAQLEYRKRLQADSRATGTNEQDGEENVLYIEGQDNDWSDSDDAVEGAIGGSQSRKSRSKMLQIKQNDDDDSSADEDDSDELDGPTRALGDVLGDESSGDSEDDSGGEGMLDVEAEEASGDDEDESESSNDDAPSVVSSEEDDDSSDGGEEEVPAVRQPKPSTLNRKR